MGLGEDNGPKGRTMGLSGSLSNSVNRQPTQTAEQKNKKTQPKSISNFYNTNISNIIQTFTNKFTQ